MNLTNNFHAAAEWSRKMRDLYLSKLYQEFSVDGRYVYIDKSTCSTILQKELAVDTIVQWAKTGGSICIEEKIEQWPENGVARSNFALEVMSCTVHGHEREGWMHYAKADYLLYAFAYEHDIGLNVYMIDFPKLREWFWRVYEDKYKARDFVMPYTTNHTRFARVPIRDVRQAVPTSQFNIGRETCTHIPMRQKQPDTSLRILLQAQDQASRVISQVAAKLSEV